MSALPIYVTITHPDDTDGTHMPMYDGNDTDAVLTLVAGTYRATTDDGIVGWVIVTPTDVSHVWPSLTTCDTPPQSFFMDDVCGAMGCHDAPHHHASWDY